jgi:hypothetical protein
MIITTNNNKLSMYSDLIEMDDGSLLIKRKK